MPRTGEPEVAARQQVLRLDVAGMRCAGCAHTIGRSLPQVAGIGSAMADHERGVVEVIHQPIRTGEDEIREHLHELGFRVTGHATQERVQTGTHARSHPATTVPPNLAPVG